MADIPKVLKNFNLFVDGRGYQGKIDEITLPDLSLVIEEHRAGGMDGVAALDMGMELMEISFVTAELNPNLLKMFGLQNQNAVAMTFRAALVDDTEVWPYIVKCSGMFSTMSNGTVKNGQKNPLTVTGKLRYYELTMNGDPIYQIDVLNMVRRIGGVDQLQAQREALGV